MPLHPAILFETFEAAYNCMRKVGFSNIEAARHSNHYCHMKFGEEPITSLNISTLPVSDEEIYLTPATLGKKLGNKSARSINLFLARYGLQKAISVNPSDKYRIWALTEKGKGYGRIVEQIHPHAHRHSQSIEWKRSILVLLRNKL